MSTPASACFFTISATALMTRAASTFLSTATPCSFAHIALYRSSGRASELVWVVRKRSAAMLFHLRPGFRARLGLRDEVLVDALAHGGGGLRRPLVEAFAGRHAETALGDHLLEERARDRRGVERRAHGALHVERDVHADEIGLL